MSPSPAPAKSLFRAQALSHHAGGPHGRIVLARPVGHAFLTAFFGVFALALVGFFCFFSYTRKVQIPGVLLPASGLVQVVASQAGLVSHRSVREGQVVAAGDPLFTLTSERASVTQGDAQATISGLLESRRESLRADSRQLHAQSAQRLAAARRQVAELAAEVRRVAAQITLQRRRVKLSEASVARFAELEAQHFVSPAQVQDHQAELLDQQLRLADLERARASGARDLANAQAEQRDRQIQAERDQAFAARDISALEQDLAESEARREVVVRAPQAGVVSAITADPGQTVGSGQVLASVLPENSPLVAEVYAPSRSAGFVRPGMPVLLRYQAFPYQKFGLHAGRVREVSRTALRPSQLGLPGAHGAAGAPDGAIGGEPLYRVRIDLASQVVAAYGEPLPLKSGMVLEASVLMESRRLYEWVLEPL